MSDCSAGTNISRIARIASATLENDRRHLPR